MGKEERDLDAMIANRIFGIETFRSLSVEWVAGRDYAEPGDPLYYPKDNPYMPELVPCYSEDIEAAWQVVEEMERRGWSYDLNSIFKPAACTFGKGFYDEYEHCWHEEYCAAAQTMPHAICLAALKAIGKVAA